MSKKQIPISNYSFLPGRWIGIFALIVFVISNLEDANGEEDPIISAISKDLPFVFVVDDMTQARKNLN